MAKEEKPIAQELAKRQKSISVAEFFEKNRQILGFDSGPRALITTVKEAVDNALDACEEAGILPDILIQIEKTEGDYIYIIVEDNGPGIVREQLPKVFAKLLYGSRFHALKQSRGQQGIGISAAVLYSQISSGKSTKVISKIGPKEPAHFYELMINTQLNEPDIIKSEIVEWERPQGTRIEMEMNASYVKGRRQSIYDYLKSTAIVNPHARIRLIEPDGNEHLFERATDILPEKAEEILPHPHGIELGTLLKMVNQTEREKLAPFLRHSFSKVGLQTAEEICNAAGLDPDTPPSELKHSDLENLIKAFNKVKIMAPSTDCLSPIGEDLIYKGLEKEYSADFIATTIRKPAIHSGNPFVIEAGIAYGGKFAKDEKASVLRFANRVPLLYQQGACALTQAVENVKWRQYGVSQPGGGLPFGPFIILIHIASTNVPFTSESKDAVANIDIIVSEAELAVKELGRKLKSYLGRQNELQKRKEKEVIITKLLPMMAKKVSDITQQEVPDINPVVANVMGNLLVSKKIEQNVLDPEKTDFAIIARNYGTARRKFLLHTMLPVEIIDPSPKPNQILKIGDEFDYVWEITLSPGTSKVYRFFINTKDAEEVKSLDPFLVEGLDEEEVTGSKAVKSMI